MKKSKWIIISNISAIVLLLFINVNMRCRDPYEFEPIFDSLTPPPAAPILLHPCNDTLYRKYTYPHDVIFEWSYIDGAQCYFFELSTDSAFQDPEPDNVQATSTCCTLSVDPPPLFEAKFFYWRVRGYSKLWWWYTDWSEVWHFTFVRQKKYNYALFPVTDVH